MKTFIGFGHFSLVVSGTGAIILADTNLLNLELPDFMMRIIGLIDRTVLSVLGYTTIKNFESYRGDYHAGYNP